jgi:tryptophan halogenase
MSGSDRIESVAVLGGGIVGLSAATAFARALPWARVTVVRTPADPAALADRMPGTLPSLPLFHRLVGIEEAELVREAEATHRVATRFERWSPSGDPWLHAFGQHGAQMKSSPFHHQWLRARRAGRALPFDRYAPAASLAAAGRFAHPSEDPRSPLSSFDYALRLEPELYRAKLEQAATKAGVSLVEGEFGGVEAGERGTIRALILRDGRRIEADLFLDCAGPSAPLVSAAGGQFDDWSEYLPCDRLVLADARAEAPSPLDRAEATPHGWRFAIPLRSRTLTGAAFSSALGEEEQAGETVALRPGRRRDAWIGNVVAFGDGAAAVDPLESTNLHLAQSAIRRALSLLPGRDFHPLLLAEYNRRTRDETRRVRDFIALHYLGARGIEGPFWGEMERRRLPDSLAHTLEQYREHGRLPKYEEESFREDSWLAVLLGLGIEPRRIDAIAHNVDFAESVAAMERLAQMSAAVPAQLPLYPEYLARLSRA